MDLIGQQERSAPSPLSAELVDHAVAQADELGASGLSRGDGRAEWTIESGRDLLLGDGRHTVHVGFGEDSVGGGQGQGLTPVVFGQWVSDVGSVWRRRCRRAPFSSVSHMHPS